MTLSDVVLKFRNNDNDEKTIELGLEVICKLRIFERRDKNLSPFIMLSMGGAVENRECCSDAF